MFDFNENTKNSAEAEMAARGEAINLLLDIMLASDMPESKKTALRVMKASKEIYDLMHVTMKEVLFDDDNLNVENAKKYLLFIIACHNQIKAFLESNPLTTKTEEEKHEADER